MANEDNLKPFRKGYDARRGSKKKGSKHLSTLIQEMANDPKFTTYLQDPIKGYGEYKGPAIKAIVITALRRAAAGDKDSREWIAKHGWWKHEPEVDTVNNPIHFVNLVPTSATEPTQDYGA